MQRQYFTTRRNWCLGIHLSWLSKRIPLDFVKFPKVFLHVVKCFLSQKFGHLRIHFVISILLLNISNLNLLKPFSYLFFRGRDWSLFLGFCPFLKFFMQNSCIVFWCYLSKPSGMLKLDFFHVEWLEFVTFLLDLALILRQINALILSNTLIIHLNENVIHLEILFLGLRVGKETVVLKRKIHSVEAILSKAINSLDRLVVVFCIHSRANHTSCVACCMLPPKTLHATPGTSGKRGWNRVLLYLMYFENTPSLSPHWRVISRGSLWSSGVRHLLAVVWIVYTLLPLCLFILSFGTIRTWTSIDAILIILYHKELFDTETTVSDQTVILALITHFVRHWRAIQLMSPLRFFLVLVVQERLLPKTKVVSSDICRARGQTRCFNFSFNLFMLLSSINTLPFHPWRVIDVIWTKTNASS